MAEEWGPWFRHCGNRCPVAESAFVAVILEGKPGQVVGPVEALAKHVGASWYWSCWQVRDGDGVIGRVLYYRIRRPLALRRLIDLAADPEKGLPPRFPVEELA